MFFRCSARQKEASAPAEDAFVQWRAQNAVWGWGWADVGGWGGRGHSGMARTCLSPARWVYHTEPGLDSVAAIYKCWGRPRHLLQLPNSRQLEPGALLAPWWVPRQRCSSREESVIGVERGGVLLYGSMVNQFHSLFPLLNIIMLSAWLLWMFALPWSICQKSIVSYPCKLVTNVTIFPACRSASMAHCIQSRKPGFLIVTFHTNLQLGMQRNTPIARQLPTAFKSKPVS